MATVKIDGIKLDESQIDFVPAAGTSVSLGQEEYFVRDDVNGKKTLLVMQHVTRVKAVQKKKVKNEIKVLNDQIDALKAEKAVKVAERDEIDARIV